VPGYEILGELGRGGMGVVYKARQAKLDRLVALKMILSGVHAGEAGQARFRTEGEAIARLQHPNIVQIHEVGEYGGLPYFSLEFCAGGSLDRKLNGTPLPPKEAAWLVETLARAMQAAHEKGVIHRDLKPANVLLLEDGTPKVTDFGLAKKVGEAGQTASGAMMGTPSYMAPEQAGGRSEQIGPLVDVYALGAILYECLTGRPPFRGPTPMDTVMQVVADEPVPVRQLQPQVPADVETICLKCLQKEPTRRYESASALADDLRRFEEGRPIVARPVRRWERATKWVRRNPMLAGMSAAMVLALLAGAVVSIIFGIDARRQAALATKNESAAIAKEKELAAANETLTRTADDLRTSRDDLKQMADNLEVTMARSLLRPLAVQNGNGFTGQGFGMFGMAGQIGGGMAGFGGGMGGFGGGAMLGQFGGGFAGQPGLGALGQIGLGALGQPGLGALGQGYRIAETEWHALWELARNRDGRVGYRFVEEASRTPGTSRQLRDRAQLALPAAVGLEESRRANVEKLLLARLADPALGAEHKKDLALALSVWDGLRDAGASITARQLIVSMTQTNDATALAQLVQGLSAVEPRLERGEAARAAAALVAAMNSKNPFALTSAPSLAQGLSLVMLHLEIEEKKQAGSQAAAVLTQAMKDPKNAIHLANLAQALSTVIAGYQEPESAARAAAQAAVALTQAMKDPENVIRLPELALALSQVAANLEPKEATKAAATLMQAMKDTSNPVALAGLASGLSAVAPRLEPKEAALASAALTQAMRDPKNAAAMIELAPALSAVAEHLDAKEAALAVAAIRQAMKDTKNADALAALAKALSAVAAHLEPKEAAQAAVTEAATALVQAMKDPKYADALSSLAQALAEVAAQMEPTKEAAQVAAGLIEVMKDNKNGGDLSALAAGLSAVTVRLGPAEAARAADVLIQAMKDAKNTDALSALAQALSEVAALMEPKDADRVAAALTQAIRDPKNSRSLPNLVSCLSLLSARLEPKEAAVVATALTQAMKDAKNAGALSSLARGLSAVAARMGPEESAQVNAQVYVALTRAINGAKDKDDLRPLFQGLASVAATLGPEEVARTAAALTQAMRDPKNVNELFQLAQSLSTVAPYMEPQEAAKAAGSLIQVMQDSPIFLASALSAVLSAAPPAEIPSRSAKSASAVAFPTGPGHALMALALVIVAAEPDPLPAMPCTARFDDKGQLIPAAKPELRPCRLSTQQLIELLKMPTCMGGARRIVLDQLEKRYRRTFVDAWEFVRFAGDENLSLDFTTPPQRP